MPSNQLILCCPLLLLPSIFPSSRVFCNESVLCIRWPKFQLQHQSFQLIFRTDSLRMDWLDHLEVQGTLKRLLQHHSSKASILQCSAFFRVQLTSIHDYWKSHSFDYLQWRRSQFDSRVGKICWRRDRLPTSVFLGFPCGLAGKESTFNAGALGSIPGLGRSPGEGRGYPLQYSDLENSMNCIVHGVTKSQTWLNDFHFTKLKMWIPIECFSHYYYQW